MDSKRLEREMEYMRRFFRAWVDRFSAAGPIGALAEWLAADVPELHGFETILSGQGVGSRDEWFVKQRCDLLLAYVSARLREATGGPSGEYAEAPSTPVLADEAAEPATSSGLSEAFTEETATTIALVRRLIHVRGEDLVHYRPRETAEVLAPQVAEYAMMRSAEAADMHMTNVQAALDLGYDWYLRLARPALRQALDTVRERVERELRCSADRASAIVERSELGTLAMLAERQSHSLGELY